MSNGERQGEVEGYKHLVASVYRVILFFFNRTGWTIRMNDPGLREMTKGYSCRGVEGACESMKGRK